MKMRQKVHTYFKKYLAQIKLTFVSYLKTSMENLYSSEKLSSENKVITRNVKSQGLRGQSDNSSQCQTGITRSFSNNSNLGTYKKERTHFRVKIYV